MRKFNEVFKEKQNKANELFENTILDSFQKVYNVLLEKYNITDFHSLNEKYQGVFLGELNTYWNDKDGLTEKGQIFLERKSDILNENATPLQKKNFLKSKANIIISETLRQSNIKYKLYDIIDEMYNAVGATNLKDILDPTTISNILKESLNEVSDNFITEVKNELVNGSKTSKVETKKKLILKVK